MARPPAKGLLQPVVVVVLVILIVVAAPVIAVGFVVVVVYLPSSKLLTLPYYAALTLHVHDTLLLLPLYNCL